jgi:hypothetical protein
MSVAIMQPYVFPYIGYFQLVDASDSFVFYDDVNFIKRGWINRNTILVNGSRYLFTIPCSKPNYEVPINKVLVDYNTFSSDKLLKTIKHGYSRAEYFEPVYALLKGFFSIDYQSIGEMASQSIVAINNYLEIEKNYYYSARDFPQISPVQRADRLIEITKALNQNHYVNSIGGKELYCSDYFCERGIRLSFIKPELKEYTQLSANFEAGLSIIDCLMNCSREVVLRHIQSHRYKC